MSRFTITSALSSLAIILFFCIFSRSAAPQTQGDAARGKYLVEEVARCYFCHTPRDDSGQPDRSRWLQGGPLWFAPVRPVRDWTESVPAIAGLGGFTEDDVLRVLETGIGPNGHHVRSPMPAFHLSRADAAAIVAYLKSLPAPPH